MKKYLVACFILITFLLSLSPPGQAAEAIKVYLPTVSSEIPPRWLGPGGGVITDLVVDGSRPGMVYAGTWGGGVYKSTNDGLSWQRINTGLGNLFIDSLAVAASNPNILYAGTYKGKIYKSSDAGLSWQESFNGIQDRATVYSLAIDPENAQRIFAGTRGISNDGNPPWNGVVYRSQDGGNFWKPVLTNVGGSGQEDWAYAIAINPNEPYQIFAATHEHGVYRSNDYGKHWEAVNNGISDLTGRALAIDPRPALSGRIYFGVFHKTGIFKSLNNGNVWVLKNVGLTGTRIYQMSIDPASPDTLYLATFDHGVLKSTNAGEHWSPKGLSGEMIGDVAVSEANHHIVFSGTLENGLFRSADGGDHWVRAQNGLHASTVTALAIDPTNHENLVASLDPGWVARSTNGGETWMDFNAGLPGKMVHQIVRKPDEPQILFALTDEFGLYRCDLNGACWEAVGTNLPLGAPFATAANTFPAHHPHSQEDMLAEIFPDQVMTSAHEIHAPEAQAPLLNMFFAPADTQIAYLGTAAAGLYRSNDSGIHWTSAGLAGRSIWGIAVAPQDPNFLYTATDLPGVIKISADGGQNWSDSYLPALGAFVYDIALAATVDDMLYAATSQGVYVFNQGTWTARGLQDLKISSIAPHPTIPGMLVAGSAEGIYVSQNGGQTWAAGPRQLEQIAVLELYFTPTNPYQIYICTAYHGVLLANY